MNKINMTPISNNMITTANLFKVKTSLILSERPAFLPVQQVLEIGPRVEGVKVGDWVYINYDRYKKHVKVKSEIRVGIGGEEMIKEETVLPFFFAPGDDETYFKITDREIDGVIKNYKELPKAMKNLLSAKVYSETMEANRLANEAAKQEADKKVIRNKVRPIKESVGPAIVAENKFRG